MIFENYPSGRGVHSATYQPGIDPPLLPCPFCGCKVLAICNTHTPSYTVSCMSCGAEGGDCESGEGCSKRAHRVAFLSAITAWNRRAADTNGGTDRPCPACESPEKWGNQHAPWCAAPAAGGTRNEG